MTKTWHEQVAEECKDNPAGLQELPIEMRETLSTCFRQAAEASSMRENSTRNAIELEGSG